MKFRSLDKTEVKEEMPQVLEAVVQMAKSAGRETHGVRAQIPRSKALLKLSK